MLELPLERVAVDEGAAFGAALLGGVAGGVWPDVHGAVAATVVPRGRVEPVPEWVEVYREQRERYRALYPALRGFRRAGRGRRLLIPARGRHRLYMLSACSPSVHAGLCTGARC